MNWYKFSQLESNWWVRFYEHLTRTFRFLFNEKNIRIDESSWSSGNDGNHLFFSFSSYLNNKKYRSQIQLQFNEKVSGGEWQGSNLVSLKNMNTDKMTRIFWFVLSNDINKNMSINNSELVGRGYLLNQDATPYNVAHSILDSILNDTDDDTGGGGNDEETDPFVPDDSQEEYEPSFARTK